ncbi:MAG: tetratricopeptide repeat protein [Deltaproteobacteria bacterium]|nr:tetratricopeptide repeat protein [Deltaproteobacteria bacterium]
MFKRFLFPITVLALFAFLAGCETAEKLTSTGDTAAAFGKFDQAIKSYDKALAKDPNYVSAILGKAKALDGKGEYAEAEKWYKKAIQKKPDLGDAYDSLATMYTERGKDLYKQKKFMEAAKWYDKVATLRVPQDRKKITMAKARECRFQAFFAALPSKLEKIDGYDKTKKILLVQGEAKAPRHKPKEEELKKKAFENGMNKLKEIAKKLCGKAPVKMPEGPIKDARAVSANWLKPRKLYGVKVGITAEKLARYVFELAHPQK